jgi:mannose-1-phosphate guanylyltransferase/mannose-6-phosphate isomerase
MEQSDVDPSIVPVILSGGSGTRLWPLSRDSRPKQFLRLTGERSLLQETVARVRELGDSLRPPIIVCNDSHRFLVAEQMRQMDIAPQTIVLEPVGRNTAPAVAIAAWLALKQASVAQAAQAAEARAGEDSDPLLLVLPSDHVVLNADAFVAAVRRAARAAAAGYIVTFGIVPDRPETGYGYLLKGDEHETSEWSLLEKFVEKPDAPTARRYVDSGRYLWNSGMFVFSARRYLDELARHAPDIATACERAAAAAIADADFTRLGAEFERCPTDSIDYAVMEKIDSAAVVPLDAGWSDIGSWAALHEISPKDADGNVLSGDVIVEGCRNSFIASSHRLVAAVGVQDYVIIETTDAVLVMPQDAAQNVKRVVDALKGAGRDDLTAGQIE